MRIELTEAHIHQGIQLPKGATLVVNAAIGANLIDMGVAKPAPDMASDAAPDEDNVEPAEDGAETDQDADKTDDLDDQDGLSS
jgi:hypothetical protein